jgi:hypothetical protein
MMDSETTLAGAKLPLTRISLPLRFTLTTKNALGGQQKGFREALLNQDLLVEAKICTSDEKCTLAARGVAKLLRFRAAVSLPLSF